MEALAAMERKSASDGERASARWLADRLASAGAAAVRIDAFRYQRSWALRQAPHFAAGLLAAALPKRGAGAALALAALVSYDADCSGRAQLLASLAPTGEGANVIGRIPARGERRRRVVLVAHHDAAQTGLPWKHPWLYGQGTLPLRDAAASPTIPPKLALLAIAAGTRRLGAVLLAVSLAGAIDVARSATVPGASDNASGVAAVLALVERFAAEPLDGTEIVAVLPGCEESGMGGMAAWLRAEGELFGRDRTLVLGLDTLGGSEPIVLRAEGSPVGVRYRDEDLALVPDDVRRFRLGAWTDPALARLAGFPALSILSVTGNELANYHVPEDLPERVDFDCVERCARLAESVIRTWAQP